MADRTFEQALRELEGRVVQLEKGELPLDEALRLFEEGVGLVRECHDRLDAAEARIVALSSQGDSVTETPPSRS
ncbi:MAG TPA: exodeoxyribonuclease VII small subunit [Myxococcota bacterium]|jgi:exodeoxyribonuclease VII small subunit|nr:exodeoxyribonuclease VII small subunit [Myxococcota bacterium]HNH46144.1 exodeoxyribonuclease VII small subunit [Myxococcota bacterium]